MSDVELTAAEEAVKKAEAALAEAKRKAAHKEYPKYVEVHSSHVDSTNGHVSVPHFPHHHVDRAGKVTVLVHDAEEEAKATSAKEEA